MKDLVRDLWRDPDFRDVIFPGACIWTLALIGLVIVAVAS